MGVLSMFNRKPKDASNNLALMRYHIIKAENDIKKIKKTYEDKMYDREKLHREQQGKYGPGATDAEVSGYMYQVQEVEKRLLGELAPLLENMQEEVRRKN